MTWKLVNIVRKTHPGKRAIIASLLALRHRVDWLVHTMAGIIVF